MSKSKALFKQTLNSWNKLNIVTLNVVNKYILKVKAICVDYVSPNLRLIKIVNSSISQKNTLYLFLLNFF